MTEAPERIWLTGFVKDEYGARLGRGTVSDLDHSPNPDYPEYIHEDAHRDQIEAAVKRALEGAADACGKPNGPWRVSAHNCRFAILNLDPAQFIDGEK